MSFEPSPEPTDPSLSPLRARSAAGQGAGSFPASDQDFILQQCVCGWTPDTSVFGEGRRERLGAWESFTRRASETVKDGHLPKKMNEKVP